MTLETYQTNGFYDELFAEDGAPHPSASPLIERLNALSRNELKRRQKLAENILYQSGNTFNVYGDKKGAEKILPFDIIPRMVSHADWTRLERGIRQRIMALNLFIDDIYNDQKIIRDGIIPAEMIFSSACYLKPCEGLQPPKGIWTHISGTDFVRDGSGEFFVLEDNLRCPSGISYVLENRAVLKSILPDAFHTMKVRPVSDYGDHLYRMLNYIAPEAAKDAPHGPNIIVLTPGIYNSAYFEHAYLAQQMGVPLAQGSDLLVEDDVVYMQTTEGLQRVDVIYRRIDDEFLDPLVFKPESLLGVPGLMGTYRKGNVALANAPGTGIADDKAIYAYVPRIIKYYLGEEALANNVPTYICEEKSDRDYVLEHLDELVVKAVNLSGGYGMLIGPKSTRAEQQVFADLIRAKPRDYIAQPTLSLSRCPTLIGNAIEGRHVDFRPYSLYGENIFTLPGGLTRVALKKGSLVVNSSQGGGSKDTWVLEDDGVLEDEAGQ
ncbi:circularly permuted type 2 ATP-grasp protein [Asticcacaulis sp. EMRT-3]|uniref:circularly permuted type 2 ATP-grasp protein n=1 Tax=Asticcacaulis sp. EMRT-3 TaxID=3040349 RepID=UPI0024AEEC52|nr:circularly permuted type 2 ATP-grasp protein [Asticcacaulis sp. EMRT-3]MDI7776328.1 circularly permuted type 2 ATP-grasp protein [Asticcacaulis sp. EMRT-3]